MRMLKMLPAGMRSKVQASSRKTCRQYTTYSMLLIGSAIALISALALLTHDYEAHPDGVVAHLREGHRRQLSETSGLPTCHDGRWSNFQTLAVDEWYYAPWMGLVYLFVLIYIFFGIALCCDEYFEPALDRITEVLGLSDDVAGATFMAVGSSAPEFFTALADAFITRNSSGVGTIVGSAMFNILMIVAVSAMLCGHSFLQIDWRPIVRDSSFYLVSIAMLFIFMYTPGADQGDVESGISGIEWWEGLLMWAMYLVYILFMFFNHLIFAMCDTCTGDREETGRCYCCFTQPVVVLSADAIAEEDAAEDKAAAAIMATMAKKSAPTEEDESKSVAAAEIEMTEAVAAPAVLVEEAEAPAAAPADDEAAPPAPPTSEAEAEASSAPAEGDAEAEGSEEEEETSPEQTAKCCSVPWWVHCMRGPQPKSRGSDGEEDGEEEEDGDSEDSDAPPPPSVSDERLALARTGDLAAIASPPALAALAKEFCDYYSETEGTRLTAFARHKESQEGTTTRGFLEQLTFGPFDAKSDKAFVACVDAALLVENKEKTLDGPFGVVTELKIARALGTAMFGFQWLFFFFALPFRWAEAWLDAKHKGEESAWEFEDLSVADKIAFLINLPFKWIFFLTIPNCGNPRFENWCVIVSSSSFFLSSPTSFPLVSCFGPSTQFASRNSPLLMCAPIPCSRLTLSLSLSLFFLPSTTTTRYMVSFFMCVCWMGALCTGMVYLGSMIGCAWRVDPVIMGVIVLAAGTSVPDLVASVAVAKNGQGSMAIANAIGSNVFDILLGLGFPWFLAVRRNEARCSFFPSPLRCCDLVHGLLAQRAHPRNRTHSHARAHSPPLPPRSRPSRIPTPTAR